MQPGHISDNWNIDKIMYRPFFVVAFSVRLLLELIEIYARYGAHTNM